jgi:hypothetical protein
MHFRLDALGRHEEAEAAKAEADALEQLIGAPQTAKNVFGQLGKSLGAAPGGTAPSTLTPIGATTATGSTAPRASRGARSGTTAWCVWEQSIADLSLTVKLPSGVATRSIDVAFGGGNPRSLKVTLGAGVVLADVTLHGDIRRGECSWARSADELTISIEKSKREVWDQLQAAGPESEPQPEPEPCTAPDAPAETAATAAATAAAPAAPVDLPLPAPPATPPSALEVLALADAMTAFDLAPSRPAAMPPPLEVVDAVRVLDGPKGPLAKRGER